MGRARKIEIRVHPLLDQLRPRLKRPARKSLEKSLIRVGQLNEVLVTADGYILDGRERYELVKADGQIPRIYWLTMHSGIGDMPPGYDREDELQMCRDVIEETGRRKWQDSEARREPDNEAPIPDEPTDSEFPTQPTSSEFPTNRILELLNSTPLDAGQVHVHLSRHLRDHLETMALKEGAVRKAARGKAVTTGSAPEYIRRLCWQDYLNHLPTPDPCSPSSS